MRDRNIKLAAKWMQEAAAAVAAGESAENFGIRMQRDGLYVEYIKPIKKTGPNEQEYLEAVIFYLNDKAGTGFRAKLNSAYCNLILYWRTQGFEIEDFQRIIDKKCAAWLGTEYQEALTPLHLFSRKNFLTYLGQKPPVHVSNPKGTANTNIDHAISGAKRPVQASGPNGS